MGNKVSWGGMLAYHRRRPNANCQDKILKSFVFLPAPATTSKAPRDDGLQLLLQLFLPSQNMRLLSPHTLAIVVFELNASSSLAFSLSRRMPFPRRRISFNFASRDRTPSDDETSTFNTTSDISNVDPEEAMQKAIAKLLVLDSDDVRLFYDDDDGGDTSTDTAQSFFCRLDSKWERREEMNTNNDDHEEADEKYEVMLEAIEDYEETYRILEQCIGESSDTVTRSMEEDAPLWAAYLDNSPSEGFGIAMAKANDDNDDNATLLIPEPNPTADRDAVSLSGVSYQTVLSGLLSLFPPKDLSLRNAASRKDGYWQYISQGKEPPEHLTYGEFDFYFFAELLDRARYYYKSGESTDDNFSMDGWEGMTFTDIGSGTGRLVFAAAALHPGFKLCRGVEVLPTIQQVAIKNLDKCRIISTTADDGEEFNDNDNVEGIYRPKAWQTQKQTDDEWLQSLSGLIIGDEDANSAEEGHKKGESACSAGDDEDEWINPDGWTAAYGSADSFGDTENEEDVENEDEDEWENPDAFIRQFDTEDTTSSHDVEADNNAEDPLPEVSADEYCLKCPTMNDEDGSIQEELCTLPLAPIEFNCGSFEDPYEYFGDSDVVFIFSSCMCHHMMQSLGGAIGRQCKPGSIIITTEFTLPLEGIIGPYPCATHPVEEQHELPSGPYKLELLEAVNGWCWLTGGESTAYIHRVVESLWQDGVGKRERPNPSAVGEARAVVDAIRRGNLADTDGFIRAVRNCIFFHGLSDEFQVETEQTRGSENEREELLV